MPEGAVVFEQRRLENELVALEPFNPAVHTAYLLWISKNKNEVFTYIAWPDLQTEADFVRVVYNGHVANPNNRLFVIYDKTNDSGNQEGSYAGIASLNATNTDNAFTELGTIVFPNFQRTHVARNTIGLLLLWTLDPPSRGGLGLRRVEWKTHAANTASRKTALRMGFEFEGITRWDRVFPGGKVGLPVEELERRNGTKGELLGRHTATYSIVWDEWDEKRPHVEALMGGTK